MPSAEEIRTELRAALVQSFEREYEGVLETWKVVEGKAQSNITIAGIFLAAAFAYAREPASGSRLHEGLLMMVILCLLGSMTCALLALRIVRVPAPPRGEFTQAYLRDIVQLPDDEITEERVARFTDDRISLWQTATHTILESAETKAGHIWRGQLLLVLAMAAMAVLAMTRLF